MAAAFYLFNFSAAQSDPRPQIQQAVELLRTGVWPVDPDTPHRAALAAGDLVLVYVAAPDRMFIGRAKLGSPVQPLRSSTAHTDRDGAIGVVLSDVEEWDPPVPMEPVLARIGPGSNARADFAVDIVRITPHEYETARAVAAASRGR